ncbi:hypothetical protein [Flavisphingomonas formosensis]|uniref:hypothetical protein n=1 Tax=Flavisphingomonas formosensis TaxID=861534 RepID=UPI0012F9AF6D|nr:hypothetical protein [Sphingomonas formosensis]
MKEQDDQDSTVPDVDERRRESLKSLGKFGAVTGLALLGMMSATKAPAASPPPP